MKHTETLIQFVLGYRKHDISVNEIAVAASEAFKQRVSQREVRMIIANYFLRDQHQIVERKHHTVPVD